MRPKNHTVGTAVVLCAAVVVGSFGGISKGQVPLTWNLAGTGNWHDANNWDPNRDRVPGTDDTAIVDQGEAQILGGTPCRTGC